MYSVREDNIEVNNRIAQVEQAFLKDKLSAPEHLLLIFKKHQVVAEDVMHKIGWINSDDTHEFLDPAVERLAASLKELERFIKELEEKVVPPLE